MGTSETPLEFDAIEYRAEPPGYDSSTVTAAPRGTLLTTISSVAPTDGFGMSGWAEQGDPCREAVALGDTAAPELDPAAGLGVPTGTSAPLPPPSSPTL